jgi:hypothetical protein
MMKSSRPLIISLGVRDLDAKLIASISGAASRLSPPANSTLAWNLPSTAVKIGPTFDPRLKP